jgi:uncharacterized protein YoxC
VSRNNADSLERRLDAVERSLSEEEPIQRTDRLDDLEARVAELEAAVQALRGYVGSVRAVNEEIEQRTEVALRKVEALERHAASVTDDEERVDTARDDGPLARFSGWR